MLFLGPSEKVSEKRWLVFSLEAEVFQVDSMRALKQSTKATTWPSFPFHTGAKTSAESSKPVPPASKESKA